MAQKPPEHDEQTAKQLLRDYIFYVRGSTEEVFVPHRIPPDVAADFIRQEVNWDIEVEHMIHACNTARFYLLRGCVGHFAPFCTERVNNRAEAREAMECIRLLGYLGDEGQQQQAQDAFNRLAGHRQLETFAEPLIYTFFHLGPKASPDALAKRLQALYDERLKNLPDPQRPDTPTNLLKILIRPRLHNAIAAKEKKDRVLGTGRDDARAYGLARMYLGLDFSLFSQEWGGYALLAEAERSSSENVVEGVRQADKAVQTLKLDQHDPQTVAEYRRDARARVVDAVVYFGGDPTPEEQEFLDDKKPKPVNLYTPS